MEKFRGGLHPAVDIQRLIDDDDDDGMVNSSATTFNILTHPNYKI